MNCEELTVEIVERARAGADPHSQLRAHLRNCEGCRARWQAENSLTFGMRQLRAAASGERSSEARRSELMAEFARLRRPAPRRVPNRVSSIAATVLLLLASGISWQAHPPSNPPEDFPDDTVFTAVPYTAPLAAGESVSVVRTQLYAVALDRMGVAVPVTDGQTSVELMLGEDGLPRAVRLIDDELLTN